VTETSPSSFFLTAEEAADLLRTTRKAVYALAERGQLPGARRFGRRLLIRRDDLLTSIEESVLSPKGAGR
jgi:excisionase family DNA binding protein